MFVFRLCDLKGVETLKKKAAVNTAFLFSYDECVRGLFLILKQYYKNHKLQNEIEGSKQD